MLTTARNRFFDADMLALLQDSRRWHVVSPLLPAGDETGPERRTNPRKGMPTHAHPYPEILLALEGTSLYGVGTRLVRCTPGTALFLGDGVSHDLGYPKDDRRFRHIWFRIVQDNVFVELHRHGRRVVDSVAWGCLFPLPETGVDFWRIWAACHAPGDPASRRLRLQTILGGLVSRLIDEGMREPGAPPDVLDQAIEAIRKHIEETGGRNASLDELARLAGYSKYYFWRAFRNRTGMSLHEFIDCSRVRKASAWLGEGRSKKEIGSLLGFSCSASFSRWYAGHREEIAAARRPAARPR